MACNKFARMLHKNCPKIVVILVYAVLEWILIVLLLLNSLFSYLISKFAKYFGLKPSCTFCSRLDHNFDSKTPANSHRHDHVCEAHGTQISKLSYCSNHRRLAESRYLCRDCLASSPAAGDEPINELSSTLSFFTWAREVVSENGEGRETRCSCCDEILSKNLHPPSLLFKPTWDVLDYYIHKKASIAEVIDAEQASLDATTLSKSVSQADDQTTHEMVFEEKKGDCDDNQDQEVGFEDDDESLYITDMLLQNEEYIDSDRFICIELIDTASQSPISANSKQDIVEEREDIQVPSVEVHSKEDALLSSQQDEDSEKCKQSFSDRAFADPSREEDSSEAVGVEELDKFPDDKQVEEENSPETMITDDLHKKLINLAKMDDLFDGSVISEIEVEDESLMTTEKLKSTIKAQQKTLNTLYAELEEERKAAAVAANETMAMITKLQEEKAAMQMEALQYQRMMEEQAEYDQEALQLLNDLMVKRDKEKQQLEKELEIYRNKVLEYESREKIEIAREIARSKKGGAVNNDSHSIDLNCQGEYDNGDDDLEGLDETGVEFDEERLGILEELKFLEAKLLALHDDEARMSDEYVELCDDFTAKKLLPFFDETAHNEVAELDKEEMIL